MAAPVLSKNPLHKWRLIDDQPWKRAYIIFKPVAETHFVPDRVEQVDLT